MTTDKHPLDQAAEQLESIADSIVEGQEASSDFWELQLAADDTVGDYPQAVAAESDEEVDRDEGFDDNDFEDEEYDADGFPIMTPALSAQVLQETANWTDVLSAELWDEGYLLNERAWSVFQKHDLGQFREYPVTVRGESGTAKTFNYVYIKNELSPSVIDFTRSEFYIEDSLGRPVQEIDISSFEEWEETNRRISDEEIEGIKSTWSISYKRLFFNAGQEPTIDIFRFERLSITTYITAKLKNAIVAAGLSGFEIKPNRRLTLLGPSDR